MLCRQRMEVRVDQFRHDSGGRWRSRSCWAGISLTLDAGGLVSFFSLSRDRSTVVRDLRHVLGFNQLTTSPDLGHGIRGPRRKSQHRWQDICRD
jgi:hypothetical protein